MFVLLWHWQCYPTAVPPPVFRSVGTLTEPPILFPDTSIHDAARMVAGQGAILRYTGLLITLVCLMHPINSHAQAQRLQGANGWLLPVASNVLSSDEAMHHARGSVDAWDITAASGSVIWPMAAGIVQYAGCNNAGGYGCWVLVAHDNGFSSLYAHLTEGSIQVQSGQRVGQWTPLGTLGWTGTTSFGPHVHFEIRHRLGRQRIDRYFSLAAMHKCDFCDASGPSAASVASGTADLQPFIQQFMTVDALRVWLLMGLIWVAVVAYVIGLNDRMLWFSVGNGSFLALVVVVFTSGAWLPHLIPALPMTAPETAQGAVLASVPTAIEHSDAWTIAYAAMRHWEGTRCVHDPVRTFRGVTQSTFNQWRNAQGLPTGDVCTISEAEAEQLYYQRYWLRSGAYRMPRSLAITHFDFAVNAGVSAAGEAFHQCGTDTLCYNNYRERFYRSLSSFSTYGAGWMNRLASIRSLTEGRG